MLVIGHGVGEWVAKRIRCHYDEFDSQALGWQTDERIVCGVIYEDYNVSSVVAHIACDRPMVPKFVWAIFDYPFNQMGVSKIICPIPQFNEDSMRLCRKFGFAEECRIRDAHPSGDMIFYTMRREDCRWLKGTRYGKR